MTNVKQFPTSKINVGDDPPKRVNKNIKKQVMAMIELRKAIRMSMNNNAVEEFMTVEQSPLAQHIAPFVHCNQFMFIGLEYIQEYLSEYPFVPVMDRVEQSDAEVISAMNEFAMVKIPDDISCWNSKREPVQIWIVRGSMVIFDYIGALLDCLSEEIGRGCISLIEMPFKTMSTVLEQQHGCWADEDDEEQDNT